MSWRSMSKPVQHAKAQRELDGLEEVEFGLRGGQVDRLERVDTEEGGLTVGVLNGDGHPLV
jgi:hypothetical protein